MPDASDPETLTDFADIESGRTAEHFLYLGALILFALHVFVEYAWHGAQSVFDTMLATGVLLVPIGLGALGIIGATIAIVDPGSAFSAVSVLAIALFHLIAGWRTLKWGNRESIDLTDTVPMPVG